MAFQLKDFLSIVASMVNRMRATTQKINDYNVGSIARTLVEAPAQEIDQLYQNMLRGLLQAIPVSVYSTFAFPALQAQPAGNLIQVTITASVNEVVISANTVFTPTSGGSVTYASTADVTFPAGDTVANVAVAAQTAGTTGNIAAATQFTISPSPPGLVSATNPSAFVNGSNAETPAQHQTRFQQFIQSLARSPVLGLQYALEQITFLTDTQGNVTEKVATAVVDEPYTSDPTQPVGLVNCYVHNGVGDTSAQLAAQGLQIINGYYNSSGQPVKGYKAAGVKVTVAPAADDVLDISAVITVASGYDPVATSSAVGYAIFSYIQGIGLNLPFECWQAGNRAETVSGVTNFILLSPSADVVPESFSKLIPGAITVIGWFAASGTAAAGTTASLRTEITAAAGLAASPAATATLT